MSTSRRLVMTDQNTSLWMDFCDDCGCAVSHSMDHVCFASAYEAVKGLDTNAYAEAVPSLSLRISGLNNDLYWIDGRASSPQPDMRNLGVVEKAAIRALLQEALRLLDPPRLSSITINSGAVYPLGGNG